MNKYIHPYIYNKESSLKLSFKFPEMLSNAAMSFIFEKMSTGSGITFTMWSYGGASKSGKKEKTTTGTPGQCCLWHYTTLGNLNCQ